MFAAILLASSFVSSLAAIANIWEQPMPLGCSSDGGNRLGEDHDKIDTDRFSCGLVAGRSYVCHGSKWSTHWRISSSAVEPQSLRLLSSSLLSSSLLRPLSSSLSSLSSLSRLLSLLRDSNATLNPCAVSRELSNIRSNASRFVSGQQLRRWSPEEPLELSQTPDPGIKHRMRVMVCISPEARSA